MSLRQILNRDYKDFKLLSKNQKFKIHTACPLYQQTETRIVLKSYGCEESIYQHEHRILKACNHPNIIKPIGSIDECSTLVLPYHSKGDLFEIMEFNENPLSEFLAKGMFSKILDAVNHLHSKNFAHLDIKPENIVINDLFEPVLIDMDQALPIGSALKRSAGSIARRAPELADHSCTDFKAADVFSLGILLFMMVTNLTPFDEDKNGFSYEFFALKECPSKFWEMVKKNDIDLGEPLKDLISKMLIVDPKKRITIEGIQKHAWLKDLPSQEQYEEEFINYMD
jgi:serine/threonine protein kinase